LPGIGTSPTATLTGQDQAVGAVSDDELVALLAVSLDTFVAERTARVKALKSDRRKEEAAALGKVRKPSRLVWALGEVARRHPDEVTAVTVAAGDVETAQSGAGGSMREALSQLRQGLAGIVARATEVERALDEADITLAVRSVLADPDARQAWIDGLLLALPSEVAPSPGAPRSDEPGAGQRRPKATSSESVAEASGGTDVPAEPEGGADEARTTEDQGHTDGVAQRLGEEGPADDADLPDAADQLAADPAGHGEESDDIGSEEPDPADADEVLDEPGGDIQTTGPGDARRARPVLSAVPSLEEGPSALRTRRREARQALRAATARLAEAEDAEAAVGEEVDAVEEQLAELRERLADVRARLRAGQEERAAAALDVEAARAELAATDADE